MTYTNSDGHFRFEQPIEAGDLVLASLGDAMVANALLVGNKAEVTLNLNSKGAVFEGRLVGEDGGPIAGAEVALAGQMNKQSAGYTTTVSEADGRYRFTGLYGGLDDFFLWAKKAGYGSETIQPIRATPGEHKTLPDLKMVLADGVIEGHVVDLNGKPASGVSVSAQTQDSDRVDTDSNGHFRLTNVSRGKHWLVAGRGNSFNTVVPASTGQTDLVIQLKPQPKDTPGMVQGDKSGQPAPPLAIAKWIQGKPLDLAALKGKIVVVDFWAIWCHPCVEALPHF